MKKYIYVVILVSLSTLVVAKNDYKEAAKPYIGTTIKILDERSDITDHLQELVPLFIKEAGINVDYRILGHFERLDYWGLALCFEPTVRAICPCSLYLYVTTESKAISLSSNSKHRTLILLR